MIIDWSEFDVYEQALSFNHAWVATAANLEFVIGRLKTGDSAANQLAAGDSAASEVEVFDSAANELEASDVAAFPLCRR